MFRLFARILISGICLGVLASALPQQLPATALASRVPLHTAIFTTTIAPAAPANHEPGATYKEVVTTAIITVLMPREAPNYPQDGALVVGTIISHLAATYPDSPTTTSTWSATQEAYWTLRGNVPLGQDPPPTKTAATDPWVTASSTLTSVFTSAEYASTSWCWDFAGRDHAEDWATSRVTFVEPLGAGYPETILRAGYTNIRQTLVAVDRGSSVYSTQTTISGWRTTTMVRVSMRPTAGLGVTSEPVPTQSSAVVVHCGSMYTGM